ncbi:MAG: hypothetical protein M1834_007964 [Cirrosporium novae-zelandiae]|nr:MAG: hypothetical protein M1834_007964 [Cirrosporium novae-zelandiae]
MSAIGSPPQSIASFQSPASSRRQSFETASRSSSRPPPAAQRRNRAALRDYYGLKNAAVHPEPSTNLQSEEVEVKESELDRPGFNPEKYVQDLLEKESLEGVLRVEGRLVNEIKALDGERKALVYDNYSKLIAATDTIRKMQLNMDPLSPATSTLAPAISHIVETAAALAESMKENHGALSARSEKRQQDTSSEKGRQQQTVRWVLDAPRRLGDMIDEGNVENAQAEWKEISLLLDRWKNVKGVTEIRTECEQVLASQTS